MKKEKDIEIEKMKDPDSDIDYVLINQSDPVYEGQILLKSGKHAIHDWVFFGEEIDHEPTEKELRDMKYHVEQVCTDKGCKKKRFFRIKEKIDISSLKNILDIYNKEI